jgi:hypothetical protein
MYFLAIFSPSISPQPHTFSSQPRHLSRHILAIFLVAVKPRMHKREKPKPATDLLRQQSLP